MSRGGGPLRFVVASANPDKVTEIVAVLSAALPVELVPAATRRARGRRGRRDPARQCAPEGPGARDGDRSRRRGRRHRTRGRRARGCARRLLRSIRGRGGHLRGQRGQAPAGARRSRREWCAHRQVQDDRTRGLPRRFGGMGRGSRGGNDRAGHAWGEGVRLRPGLRARSRRGRGRADVRARWTRRRRMRCRTGAVPSVRWRGKWRTARRRTSPAAAASGGHAKAAASS